MKHKICCLLVVVCYSVTALAQADKNELQAYVTAVQNAYDNNSDSLEYYVNKGMPLALKLKDINSEIKMQRLHAIKLFVNGQSDKAIKILMDVVRDAEHYPVSYETALLYYATAQVYSTNRYKTEGEKYLRKGIAFALQVRNDTILADGYNRMGIWYEKKEMFDSALYFYQKAFDYNDKAGALLGKAYSLENLAGIYAQKNDLKSALACQRQSMIYKEEKGKKIDIAIAYINLAETFDRMKQMDSAVFYAKMTVKLAAEIKYRDLQRYGNQLLSDIYERHGDIKTALEYHKKYALLNDTVYNETINKQLAEQSTKYQAEKKEQKIKELNQQTLIQNLQLKQRNIFLLITVGLLIAGAIIVYLANNRRKFKEQAKLQAERSRQQAITTREVINAEERERKRIAADLHDGVGQLLSATIINLDGLFKKRNIDKGTDQAADRIFSLLTESYDELRAISHQMMPNALLKAGLGSAIKELISGIHSDKLSIGFESVGLNERLAEEVETVLYRVIQESINNVIKHANATKLNIQVIKDEDGISVTIEDNGRGFDMKQMKSDGIGLKNMYSRVQFQNGTVDIDSKPGKGTLVAIHVPIEATRA